MRKNFCFCPRSTAIITISAHKNDQKNGLLNYFWRTEKQLRPLVALDSEVGGAATYRQKKGELQKKEKFCVSMFCAFDGGRLVSFMHATNDTSRRSNGSRQGRNEKKRSRWKENPIRKWCAFGFVTLRNKTVFYIAAAVWCLQKLVTCLSMTSKSSKKKKRVSFLCHCVG